MENSITVGNRKYDARTGLPLSSADGSHVTHTNRRSLRANRSNTTLNSRRDVATPAKSMHLNTQKSKTLSRKYTKRPHSAMNQSPIRSMSFAEPVKDNNTKKQTSTISPRHRRPTSAKSLHGSKKPTPTNTLGYRPKKSTIHKHSTKRIDSIKPSKGRNLKRPDVTLSPTHNLNSSHKTTVQQPAIKKPVENQKSEKFIQHPVAKKVNDKQTLNKHETTKSKQNISTPPASVIKDVAINEALDNAPKHHAKQYKPSFLARTKILSVVCGCLALLIFGGYLTYINAPNLSVRVAAAQAGIDASYPSYHPHGYSLNGPVAYSDGEVNMKFVANANKSRSYSINQSRSNWDSNALLENYVKTKSNGEYTTSQVKGITIYSFNGDAAWVSGGILYTITGNASLSPDQIQKIATSVT